jgi:FMN phosphatase YigB (HAD superfamily)
MTVRLPGGKGFNPKGEWKTVVEMKAVFFDFVGTLITKEGENETHLNIIREVLRGTGVELNAEEVWRSYEEESSRLFSELAGR